MKSNNLIEHDSSTAAALTAIGVDDLAQFLQAADELKDPTELAELLDIDDQTFDLLVNRAGLCSLNGLGSAYVNLLAVAGIGSILQLQACDPFELHERIKQVVQQSKVGRVPNRATVEDWIENAREYIAGKPSNKQSSIESKTDS